MHISIDIYIYMCVCVCVSSVLSPDVTKPKANLLTQVIVKKVQHLL